MEMAKLKRISDFEEQVLLDQYFNEYEVIDGMNQHCLGLTFREWLEKKGYKT